MHEHYAVTCGDCPIIQILMQKQNIIAPKQQLSILSTPANNYYTQPI
jgi:hypothetical protein